MNISKLKWVVVLLGLGACSWFATDHGPVSKRTRGGPLPASSRQNDTTTPLRSTSNDDLNPKPAEGEQKEVHPKGGVVVHCDTTFVKEIGKVWYIYNDDGCHRGGSNSELSVLAEGTLGKSCQVRWSGRVTAGTEHAYTGMATNLGESSLVGYQTLTFRARGDGRSYRVKLPMDTQLHSQEFEENDCDNRDFDMFGKDFTCGDGTETWQEVTVDIKRLKQEGWGRKWTFDASQVHNIQIQTKGSPISSFKCDVELVSLE